MRKFTKYPATRIVGAADSSQFEIEGTVLLKYHGPGGHVVIPEGVTEIGRWAFYYMSVTSVKFPKSLVKLGERAFYGCDGLTRLNLPSSVRIIGELSFARTGLTSVVIPEGVIELGRGAFASCSNLTTVKLPTSLKVIGDCAFQGCDSLTAINVPKGIEEMGVNVLDRTPLENQSNELGSEVYDELDESEEYEEGPTFNEWYTSEDSHNDNSQFAEQVEQKLKTARSDIHEVFNEPSVQGMMGADYWYITIGNDTYEYSFNWYDEQVDIFSDGPEAAAEQYASKILAQLPE